MVLYNDLNQPALLIDWSMRLQNHIIQGRPLDYSHERIMNRYRSAPGLRPTQASTTTTCQKCLKKGHYSYECKSSVQSRPYSSRPSRSQQLQNPKLQPRLKETKLEDLDVHASGVVSKEPVADLEDDRHHEPRVKRARHSPVSESSSSVSSISTHHSASPPAALQNRRRSSSVRPGIAESRRAAAKGVDAPPSEHRRSEVTRRRRNSQGSAELHPQHASSSTRHGPNRPSLQPERSLSPFSKRLALTQAMNT